MNALSIDTESFQAVYFNLHGGRDLLRDFVTLAHSFRQSLIKTHDDVMNKQRLNKTALSKAQGMIMQVIRALFGY